MLVFLLVFAFGRGKKGIEKQKEKAPKV